MSTKLETRTQRMASAFGRTRGGELLAGGMSVGRLAEQMSTPCYVYNGDAIADQIKRVRAALGPETELHYSLRANPSLGLCQLIAEEGAGAEVASIGELTLSQRAGFSSQKTIFAGPGKTDEELELAVMLAILAVNVESPGELERLAEIARRLKKAVQVALRVNPAYPVKGAQVPIGGGPQQFGIDEEILPDVVQQYRDHPYLRLVGLHVYTGTQMFDVEALLDHYQHVMKLGQKMASHLGKPLEVLGFEGGFGVPYFEGSPEFDLQAFAEGCRQLVQCCKADPHLANARLIIELGHYLVAEAGVYVTRVLDVKQSRGKTFVVTDGGMNHHIMATGNLGQVGREPYPIALLQSLNAPAYQDVAIVGPCCTALDTFSQDIPFPQVKVGDFIGIFCSGAYGYSASSLAFLSHPTPAEVLVWQDRAYVLRAPGRCNQVLEGQFGLDLQYRSVPQRN